jgi:guanidinopropionase
VTYDRFEEKGRDWLLKKIDQVTGKGPIYITIDIDGLDPAWAIGTGVPEIGGLTPRDCQVILRSLQGKNLVGGDICEVAPCYDPSGITSVTAANLMWEMLCVIADARASRRK